MPITKEATVAKTIKAMYVTSRDGKTKSKVDLTALAKIVDATLANKGIVQLQTEINDTETTAATPKAVNTVKKIADGNAKQIADVKKSIDEALPGEGTLADKLKNVAFTTKDNNFTESQTLVAKDAAGTETANVTFKTGKFDTATGAFDAGSTKLTVGNVVTDKNGKVVGKSSVEVADAGRDFVVGLADNAEQIHGIKIHLNKDGEASSATAFAPATPDAATGTEIATAKFVTDKIAKVQDSLENATDTKAGIVKLADAADDSLDAATGGTAVTPKALAGTEAKVKAVTDVVGENAENAALVNKANEFTETQTVKSKDGTKEEVAKVQFKGQHFNHEDGTFDNDAEIFKSNLVAVDKAGKKLGQTVVHANAEGVRNALEVYNADNSKAGAVELKFNRAGDKFAAYAPSTDDAASKNEIATADFVNKKLQGVQDNLVDATDTQRGLTMLSDAVDSEKAAADGKTAATPKAVKTVNDALVKVSTVVGENAEHAALKNKENTFAENQTFDKQIRVKARDGSAGGTVVSVAEGSAIATGVGDGKTANTSLTVNAADDETKAFAGVEVSVKGNGRTAELFVTGVDGTSAGALGVKTDNGHVTAYAPQPTASAKDEEIATVKFVKDKVGDLDAEHVAYTHKSNTFEKPQNFTVTTAQGTVETNGLVGKVGDYDHAGAAFDQDSGHDKAEFSVSLVDKNNKTVGGVTTTAEATKSTTAISVAKNDGTTGSVAVAFDTTTDKFVATAPETDAAAKANEIATAKFVNDKADSIKTEVDGKLKRVTDVIGEDAENAALVNKGNVFTQNQKIQTDGKILNVGGTGAATEGSADDALVLGSSFETSSAEIIIAANGSIVRSELPEDPDDLELATVGYVKSLGDISGSMRTGDFIIAMQDFTQTAVQGAMDEGVFYSVPFNAADQYIQIDPETGKPAETQADGVTDKKVDHFVVMYKAPTSKLVMNLGDRKVAPDFADVPLLSKDNNFSGTNSFKDAQKATPSVDAELSDVNGKSFITKSELISYFTKHAPWSNVVTVEPALEDMVPGQIYFLVEE